MSDHGRRSQSTDPFMMSGARDNDETLGQDLDETYQATDHVVPSIENGLPQPADELGGSSSQARVPTTMRPPQRARCDSVNSEFTDCNRPEVIANLFGTPDNGRNSVRPSPRPSPGPRPLNLGNSMLNRRSGGSSTGSGPSGRDRALSRQREIASRFQTEPSHDEQAAMMTGGTPPNASESGEPTSLSDVVKDYEAAHFSASRRALQYKHSKGLLTRSEEMKWIQMESRHRKQKQDRGRSMSPADEDEDIDYDPVAASFDEVERALQDLRQNGTSNVNDEIEFMRVRQMEEERRKALNRAQARSRGSTPSQASGLFVDDRGTPRRGFEGSRGDGANIPRGKYPRRKYYLSSEVARKRAKKAAKSGQIPNRTNPRAAPRKGFGDDGRGRNLEFGDYFLKVSANDERPDVIESYLDHVAHEVAVEIAKKATLPIFMGTLLKDRLRQIRKSWNTKTKAFCKKYGLPAPPKRNRSDEEEQRFNRAKGQIYARIRAGQLNLEQASRFGVEANIEMCRWRAKYHQAIGNTNAPSNLPDLSGLDGLKLPTTEEFDTAYKPKYDKIIEFVGQMFAECQDRIRMNHDRLHGIFSKVEIPDPYDEESSDESEDEDENERDPEEPEGPEGGPDGMSSEEAAIAAALAADKANDAAQAARAANEDDDAMFPENTV
ncbi:hypothetical protein PRZ48_014438 [Zasmidium cellare]|uniref:Uncharacterized protein n=1 Tax=Zasmidium cellare TaxID=395010 RepID=A0ABR0DYQ9_ZASCE|nr:hypothetical protein PRZ48_014438 [Zasmidium cellare]